MTPEKYHLYELSIANDPEHPSRIMPQILESDRRILDAGCGAGQTLIASRLDADVVAVGIDVDRTALMLGRRLDDRLCLLCARGEFIPFRSDSFDLVLSRVAVPYMNVPAALTEMWRVLTPGGRLWIVLHPFSMTVKDLLRSLFRLNMKGVVSRLLVILNGIALNWFGKALRLPFRKGRCESFQTNRGITKQLRSIGFDQIVIDRSRFFIVTARKSGRSEQ